mmetsp:Transcript_20056/g.43016  ORF Transcript_20056/g.43016 Transcript_20056/m.43016 type:complete len:230 (-) Transcript_20056:310-999(-)
MVKVQPRSTKHLAQRRLPIVGHNRVPLVLELVPHEIDELLRAGRRREVDVVVNLHRPVEVGPKQAALGLVLGGSVHRDVHLERRREHLESLEGEGSHGAGGGHLHEAPIVSLESAQGGDDNEVAGAAEVGGFVNFDYAIGAEDILEAGGRCAGRRRFCLLRGAPVNCRCRRGSVTVVHRWSILKSDFGCRFLLVIFVQQALDAPSVVILFPQSPRLLNVFRCRLMLGGD